MFTAARFYPYVEEVRRRRERTKMHSYFLRDLNTLKKEKER